MSEANSNYNAGGKASDEYSTNWGLVLDRSQAFLSPQQQAVLKTMVVDAYQTNELARTFYQQELAALAHR